VGVLMNVRVGLGLADSTPGVLVTWEVYAKEHDLDLVEVLKSKSLDRSTSWVLEVEADHDYGFVASHGVRTEVREITEGETSRWY
jgi:hypothetical protein